jgi:hypothetical protein
MRSELLWKESLNNSTNINKTNNHQATKVESIRSGICVLGVSILPLSTVLGSISQKVVSLRLIVSAIVSVISKLLIGWNSHLRLILDLQLFVKSTIDIWYWNCSDSVVFLFSILLSSVCIRYSVLIGSPFQYLYTKIVHLICMPVGQVCIRYNVLIGSPFQYLYKKIVHLICMPVGQVCIGYSVLIGSPFQYLYKKLYT